MDEAIESAKKGEANVFNKASFAIVFSTYRALFK